MQKVNLRLSSAVITDKGLSEKRLVNEDAYLEMPERGLFAVADGVGGAQAGDFASQTAMEVLHEAFSHSTPNADPEDLLEVAIQRANESIYRMAHELPQLEMMATTIVALKITGNVATIGHVGDSRLYRLTPNGIFSRETNDHSIVEEEVRAGRMTATQAANHPSRNVISRALGAESAVEVEMRTIMFEPGTVFLLCSDGITRHLSDYEIKQVLVKNQFLEQACQELKLICFERGAEDNLTALIVRAEDAKAPIVSLNDEEATLTGSRAKAAASSPATLVNTVPRGAELTEARPGEFTAKPIVSPEANTAPLEIPSNFSQGQLASPSASTSLRSGLPTNDNWTQEPQASFISETPAEADNHSQHENSSRSYVASGTSSIPLGKILTPLLSVLVGIVIGAVSIYALTAFNPPPANAPAKTASNVPATISTNNVSAPASTEKFVTFERARRLVDAEPRNAATIVPQPSTATDLYLIGRAFLQTGDYNNARTALNKAAELAAQANDDESETLRVDIATALAAIAAMSRTSGDRRQFEQMLKTK